MASFPTPSTPYLLQAHGLSGGPADHVLIRALSFNWSAGLHWVCGDEGSGKTSLLHLLSGQLPALHGSVTMPRGGIIFWADLKDPEHDQTTVHACWEQLRIHYPQWSSALLQDLSEALDMRRHQHKPLYMLSSGSRHKVVLIAALAAGATVTLLDQPFVALDPHSIKTIKAFLQEAAAAPDRAWIVADYEVPDDLPLASVLNLSASS